MSDIKFVTLSQFEKSPELQKEYGGDYQKFLTTYIKEMKSTPLFTLAKTGNYSSLPNSIRDSIWSRSKEADKKKELSEQTYELARQAEQQAIAAQEAAESQLAKLQNEYAAGNTSSLLESNINNAQNKLRELMKSSSNATLAREIAGEHMVADSKASLRAFQSGMLADASIKLT